MSKRVAKNVLETLFESKVRIKILKFLFRNMDAAFGVHELSRHVQERPALVRKELKKFSEIGLLRLKH